MVLPNGCSPPEYQSVCRTMSRFGKIEEVAGLVAWLAWPLKIARFPRVAYLTSQAAERRIEAGRTDRHHDGSLETAGSDSGNGWGRRCEIALA